jgi:hypothetical protein
MFNLMAFMAAAACSTIVTAATQPLLMPPPFREGDIALVTVTKSRFQMLEGRSVRSPVARMDARLEVLQAGPSGYLVTWTLAVPGIEGASPDVQARVNQLLKGMEDLPVMEIALNPPMAPVSLRNWEEVRDASMRLARLILPEVNPGMDARQLAHTFETVDGFFSNRSFAEASLLKDVAPFFSMYGYELNAQEPLEFDEDLANPFGGPPLSARFIVTVIDFEDSAPTVRIQFRRELRPEGVAEFVRSMMHRFAPDAEQVPDGFRASLSDIVVFTYDPASGWFTDVAQERIVEMGDGVRTDRTQWTLTSLEQAAVKERDEEP